MNICDNPWQLYDDLIDGIPDNIRVTDCNCGYNWTSVCTNEGGTGIAMTIPVYSLPQKYNGKITDLSLKALAELSKSWNFVEAALGVAAIGAYYNHPSRAKNCGIMHSGCKSGAKDAFDLYQEEIKGKKVAAVGHFPMLKRFQPICDLTILERKPQWGDYPDSACEYLMSEQDYVFITGCTLVNKTMPRLLELAKHAKVVLVGPSTILSPVLFQHGVYGLSGLIIHDAKKCDQILRQANMMSLFDVGEMVDLVRPSK